MLLAWVFVVELIVAAAVPLDAGRDNGTRPAQLVTPRTQPGQRRDEVAGGR